MSMLFALLIPCLVAIYTGNYGRWAWNNGMRGGAVGLYALSVLTLAVPLFSLWINR